MNIDRFKNEYPALSTISIIFKTIGIIIIIFSFIGLIYGISLSSSAYSDTEKMVGVIIILASILIGLLSSLPFFANAELIKIFARIELNTRKEQDDYSITQKVTNNQKPPVSLNEEEKIIFYCRKCTNRKISNEVGLLCFLTGEKPAFQNECPNFKER